MSAEHSPIILDPGTYLEIGVGADECFRVNPTTLVDVNGAIGPRHFVNGARYVGMDRPHDSSRYWIGMHAWLLGVELDAFDYEGTVPEVVGQLALAERLLRNGRPDESINFMAADAHDLPFPDGSIREVYACDVLSSQLEASSIARILGEVRRVLQTNGRLVTRECFTPQWFNEAQLRSAAPEAGLRVARTTYHGSPEYKELAYEYGATSFETDLDVLHDGSMYFAVLEPAR